MIDGLYNATTLLLDPSCARRYRISGLYRMREALLAEEARYGHDPRWNEFLDHSRKSLELGLRVEKLTIADLDDKQNKWPLLGDYLKQKPDSEHKRMLRTLTHGFWKEYSAISHASYDGLISIYPYVADDRVPREIREHAEDAAERTISMHIGRASGLLLCLLTEIQHYCKFQDANIDRRSSEIWSPLIVMLEVRELFEYRYRDILRVPVVESPAVC